MSMKGIEETLLMCRYCGNEEVQTLRALVHAAASLPPVIAPSPLAQCLENFQRVIPLAQRLAPPPRPTAAHLYCPSVMAFEVSEAFRNTLENNAPFWATSDAAALLPAWEAKMQIWERLWYCDRCDHVYDPETGRETHSQHLARLIHA
jgi:hypothetical protein